MNFIIEIIIAGITALVITLSLTPLIKRVALKINLVDQPNYRKVHKSPVPLIGGITIALASAISILLTNTFTANLIENLPILVAGALLLITGSIDDKIDVRASYRLLIQIGCAYAVCSSGIRITSLYGIFGIYDLPEMFQYILTIIIITGVVNAFNLMDGIDGLAGGLAIVGFILMATLFFQNGQHDFVILLVALTGALTGFLRFNLSKKKIFLGDGGSLLLGFVMVVSGIKLIELGGTSGESIQSTALIAVTSMFLLPVLDSLRVYYGRIKKGISPFQADKSHLHHLILLLGINHRFTSAIIILTSVLLIILSFTLVYFFSLTGGLILSSVLFLLGSGILVINKNVKEWRRRIAQMEKQA